MQIFARIGLKRLRMVASELIIAHSERDTCDSSYSRNLEKSLVVAAFFEQRVRPRIESPDWRRERETDRETDDGTEPLTNDARVPISCQQSDTTRHLEMQPK